MAPAPDHDALAPDLAAFLLGALPEADQERFAAHLAACETCQADLERLSVAAEALPGAAPLVEPPPELKARIMAVVEQEAELLAAAGVRADRPDSRRRPGLLDRVRARLGGAGRARAAVAALAAVAGLAVGLAGGELLAGGEEVRTVQGEADPRLAPDARVSLEAVDGRGTLVIRGLPPAPGGRVYQVWVVPEGEQTPEPTDVLFGPRESGEARVAVPGRLGEIESVVVTDEPQGGSEVPTGEAVLAVSPA